MRNVFIILEHSLELISAWCKRWNWSGTQLSRFVRSGVINAMTVFVQQWWKCYYLYCHYQVPIQC